MYPDFEKIAARIAKDSRNILQVEIDLDLDDHTNWGLDYDGTDEDDDDDELPDTITFEYDAGSNIGKGLFFSLSDQNISEEFFKMLKTIPGVYPISYNTNEVSISLPRTVTPDTVCPKIVKAVEKYTGKLYVVRQIGKPFNGGIHMNQV